MDNLINCQMTWFFLHGFAFALTVPVPKLLMTSSCHQINASHVKEITFMCFLFRF